ncbi:C2 domain and von Willebrand factor, type A domain and Copine domain-containing protein [Aphelenchoides besseyi]|nr:C2 domain and von Willebrand factor, type A domain and Copine domain-containing protein [Aphelenchoides besseyi]
MDGAFDTEIVLGGSTFPHPAPLVDEYNERKSAQVMLTISASDIKDVDPDSGTDPYCVVSVSDASMVRQRHWEEIGRTETLTNTIEPEWATKIIITYYFEEQQRLQFEIFDKTGIHKKRVGNASMLLHEIVGAKYNRLSKDLLEEGKHHGVITVSAEELSEGRQESVYFVVSASDLDRKDFLGKCDPFLKIFRYNEDQTLQLAYRTRYHAQTYQPRWKPFEIHINQLCYGDKDREFLIECYDWDADGEHDLVGACNTTVNRLLSGVDKTLPLINEKKARKTKKYVDSGKLHFHKCYCWMDWSFFEFISGGTELDFTVAIDFTKSNLPMDEKSSLHHLDESKANQYEIGIAAVADICQHYNSSKIFKGYGFGARVPPDTKVRYNFPLNLETNDPKCRGVQGLLEAYLIAQSRVELSGPTDFAPLIRFVARQAAATPEDGSKYNVLLILTDGVITDIEATKEEIIKASTLPLSIIVVGVGYDSFDEMKILDSDHQMLSVTRHGKREYAKRDIVQFVQLRKYLPPHRELSDHDLEIAKAKLAKEVLYEVPGQLTSYMKSKGIYPRSPASPFDWQDLQTSVSPNQSLSDSFHASSQNSPRSPRRLLPAEPSEPFSQMHIY